LQKSVAALTSGVCRAVGGLRDEQFGQRLRRSAAFLIGNAMYRDDGNSTLRRIVIGHTESLETPAASEVQKGATNTPGQLKCDRKAGQRRE
jgi:hypothetical protein